jgi:TPR repeat protein
MSIDGSQIVKRIKKATKIGLQLHLQIKSYKYSKIIFFAGAILAVILTMIPARHLGVYETSLAQKETTSKISTGCVTIDYFFNDPLLVEIQKKYDKNPTAAINSLERNSKFKELKLDSLKNDTCGVMATRLLYSVYSATEMEKERNDTTKRMIEVADNNLNIMNDLCIDTAAPISQSQRERFCEAVVNSDDPQFKDLKRYPEVLLLLSYPETKQVEKIIKLCERKNTTLLKSECYNALSAISVYYNNNKIFDKTLGVLEKQANYDDTGFTQLVIADRYLYGLGADKNYNQAIYWYNQALLKLDDKYFKTRREALNNLGIAYAHEMNYVEAATCYKEAAKMNNSTAQLNLARLYISGRGVITDHKKAYAWASLAIAIGLNYKESETMAIKIKDWETNFLVTNNRSGQDLKEAQKLAKQYYKKFILIDSSVDIEE